MDASEWITMAAVLGMAVAISLFNYLGLRRAATRPPDDRASQSQAYLAMEHALSSQSARLDGQSRRIDELEAEILAQRAAYQGDLAVLREELEQAYEGVRLLLSQLNEAGMSPVWMPPTRRPINGGAGVTTAQPARLAKMIAAQFALDEMTGLAFELGIEGDVTGETTAARAQSLVGQANRRGLMERLISLCREQRPVGGF